MKTTITKNKKYIFLAAAILLALCVVFYKNLSYTHEMQGGTVAVLSRYYAQAEGYEVTDMAEGTAKRFTVAGNDPKLYLAAGDGQIISGQRIGGVELVFGSNDAALPVQVFYRRAGSQDYSERTSVKAELEPGESVLLLPLPLAEYDMLRIDIDGDFILREVNVCTGRMTSAPYISEKTVRGCLWYFPAVIIGFVLIFWAHGVRMREVSATAGGYARYVLFGGEAGKGREVHYDYVRILAAVFVILAHTCSPMLEHADADWKRFLLVCGLSLGLCCNLIYVMLSGALLLGRKSAGEESVGSFYVRRVSKVVIPLAAYYLLSLLLNREVSFLPPRNIGSAFKRIMTGAPGVAPHLWLIYTIVALYLVTPFFRVMVQHLGDRMLLSLAAAIFVLNALTTYLPLFGMAFGVQTFLAGWEGIFLLGYIMARYGTRNENRRRDKLLPVLAAACYVLMTAVVFLDSGQMDYVYNIAPPMIVTSCGIFLFFVKNRAWFADKSNPAVRFFSKYSYSVILIHWYVLFVVVQGRLHVTALRFGCIGGIGASVVLTFFIGLAMAVVFDNTAVIVCSVLFDKAVRKLSLIFPLDKSAH